MNKLNGDNSETKDPITRMKEIGVKGFAPMLNVVLKHKDQLSPYLGSFEKALKAGADSLNQVTSSDTEQTVGHWCLEASTWVGVLKQRIESTQTHDLINYLEEESKNRPALMFALSYVVGLGMGRFGRHLGQKNKTDTIH